MPLRHRSAAVAAALFVTLGAGAAVAVADSSAGASHKQTITVTRTLAGRASVGANANGTMSVTLTGPKRTVTASALAVVCSVKQGSYQLLTGFTGKRAKAQVTLRVPDYSGAGSYKALVKITRDGRRGVHSRTLKLPVKLTASGGSGQKTHTLSGKKHPSLAGKTVAVSATWTCSA